MKTTIKFFVIGLVGSLGWGAWHTFADFEVSGAVHVRAPADFYAPLTPVGVWIEVDSYGRCWHPSQVAVDWRPYCDGYWVWTECGWYWVSDEPWAWACYHYGWWFYHPQHAWVWVPGIEWGPAWVSWRVGDGFIGWAPLPPRGITLTARASGVPPPFVFVEVNRFHERMKPSTVIVNDTTIIRKTTVVNNIRRETKTFNGSAPQKVVINEGPGLAKIQSATANKVRVVSIGDAVRQTPFPPAIAQERKLPPNEAARPGVAPTPPEKPQPSSKDALVPAPARPPTPEPPPPRPGKTPDTKGKGKGGGKDKP